MRRGHTFSRLCSPGSLPLSDLAQSKLRPTVVLADAGRGDWILCQITSNPYGDPRAIMLTSDAFSAGTLRPLSYARPGKLFTANQGLLMAEVGTLTGDARYRIVDGAIAILRPSA
jgi:mRNA interferase MazF